MGLCPANWPVYPTIRLWGSNLGFKDWIFGCYSWKERRDSSKRLYIFFPCSPNSASLWRQDSEEHSSLGSLLPKQMPGLPTSVVVVHFSSSPSQSSTCPASMAFPTTGLPCVPALIPYFLLQPTRASLTLIHPTWTALNHRLSLLLVSLLQMKCVFKFPINIPTYVNMSCFYYFKILLLLNDTHLYFHSYYNAYTHPIYCLLTHLL